MESSQEQKAIDIEFEMTHHCGRAGEESISYTFEQLVVALCNSRNKIQSDNKLGAKDGISNNKNWILKVKKVKKRQHPRGNYIQSLPSSKHQQRIF